MKRNKFRVMSWNIGQFYTPYLWLADHLPFLNKGVLPERYIPRVARTIRLFSPQVVCLQEIRDKKYTPEKICQLQRLENELKKEYRGFYGPYSYGGERRAILVKREYADHPSFRIEEINVKKGDGVAIAAYIPQKDTWVASLHLEHYDFDLRQKQLQKVFAWLNKRTESIILAGDYNMRKTFIFTERYRQQIEKFFNDLGKKYKLRDASKDIGKTYFLKGLDFQLDYFFTNLPKRKKEKAFVLKSKRWWMMDHYPIVGDFIVSQRKVLAHVLKKPFLSKTAKV